MKEDSHLYCSSNSQGPSSSGRLCGSLAVAGSTASSAEADSALAASIPFHWIFGSCYFVAISLRSELSLFLMGRLTSIAALAAHSASAGASRVALSVLLGCSVCELILDWSGMVPLEDSARKCPGLAQLGSPGSG